MKASKLGILSAFIASICCIGPLLLILLGLGSLGVGAVIGKYHWYFIAAGTVSIIFAWRRYFKEKKTCSLNGCRVQNKKITLGILLTTTSVVAILAALNLYTYVGQKDFSKEIVSSEFIEAKTEIISVEGMTCFSCEIAVSSALKKIDGVVGAKVSVKAGKVQVKYAPSKTNISQLIETVNKTGYKASLPEE